MKKFYLFLILLSISCMGVRCEMFDHDINPRLIYTDPVKNDRNVPANTSFMFMFDWHIKPHTLKSDTIYLEANDGTIIYGKGEFYGTKVIIFTPQKNHPHQEFALEKLTEYKVIVKDDLIDTNKQRLKKTYKFDIATSNEVDGIRPKVETITLDKNKKDIYIQFSEKINLLTINSNTIKLEQVSGATKRVIEGKIKYNEEKNRAKFESKEKLKDDNIYSLTVSNLVEDLCSNQLLTVCTKIFANNNTNDTTPPTVVNYEKEINDEINVEFSEKLDPFTLQAGNAALLVDEYGKKHEIGVVYNDSTKSIKITPVKELPNKTSYTLTIFGGSIGVKDIYQNAMTENFTFEFHKAINAAPIVTFTNFEQENGGITGDDPIRIMFDKPLMKSSVTEESFKVTNANGTVAGTRELSSGDRILTFKPTENDGNFEYDITYDVTLTTEIKDADGYELEQQVNWSFEAIDDSPLDVIEALPDYGYICYLTDQIQVTFNKDIIPETINCYIKSSNTDEVLCTVELQPNLRTVIISPPGGLLNGQSYTIRVDGSVEDKYGFQMGQHYNYSFYTGAVSGENALIPAPGYATFGGTNELRKDDSSLLKNSVNLNSNISDLFDTVNTGKLTNNKYLRMLVNGKNIVKEKETNLLTPIYKSIPVYTGYAYKSPPANQVYVDLANRRVVLPRPSYWSKCDSLANLTGSAQIKERAPGYAKTGSGKFKAKEYGFFGYAINFSNFDETTIAEDNNGIAYVYPFNSNGKNTSSGTISLELRMEMSNTIQNIDNIGSTRSIVEMPDYQSCSVFYIFNEPNLKLYFQTIGNDPTASNYIVNAYLNVNGVVNSYTISGGINNWKHIFIVWDKNNLISGNGYIKVFVNSSLILNSSQSITNIDSYISKFTMVTNATVRTGKFEYLQSGVNYTSDLGASSTTGIAVNNIKIWNHVFTTSTVEISNVYSNKDFLHTKYSGSPANIKFDYYYLP